MSLFGALVKTVLLPVTVPVAIVVDVVEVITDTNRGESRMADVLENVMREVEE